MSKNITPALNEVLLSVTKCIHVIKKNAKCERLFKQFYENVDHVKLLLHTEVRWLSNGNCLKGFMDQYNVLIHFLSY